MPACNNVTSPRGLGGDLPIVEAGLFKAAAASVAAPTPEQDYECASAGIAAEGLTGPPTLTVVPAPPPWPTQREGFPDL